MMNDTPKKIAIVGNGYAPYLIALFLRKNLQTVSPEIVVVDQGESANDTLLCTLGETRLFHAELGLSEVEFVRKTRAEVNLGFDFSGFNGQSSQMFSDAQYGFDLDNRRFHYLFRRLKERFPDEVIERYCLSACLARAERFTPPSNNPRSVYNMVGYGYRVPASSYREFLQTKLPDGIIVKHGSVESVELTDDGRAKTLLLKAGETVSGDLFIDASCSRVVKNAVDRSSDLRRVVTGVSIDASATATDAAHCLPYSTICNRGSELVLAGFYGGRQYTTTFSLSSETADDARGALFFDASPWVKNCVAMAAALTDRVPTLIDNSHVLQGSLARLIDLWPRTDNMHEEAKAFNSRSLIELRHVLDVDRLILGEALAAPELMSATMRYKRTVFQQSGKVVYYENEVLHQQQWPALFYCLGVEPEAVDLSVGLCDESWLENELLKIKSTFGKAANAAPRYHDFIQKAHG